MMQIVANFSIPYTQLLNPQGELCGKLPLFAQDSSVLLELYRIMVLTRIFDKKAIALQRTGKMGTYPPINGQEAISAAIGHALLPTDVFIPYYRDYAAQFQRGVNMTDILRYWGGDERGNLNTGNSQDLPICIPIASQCLHAAGIAYAFKHRKQPRVALVCLGDGGSSEGDFYEAMNAAGVWKLPIVFVVNNNQWAISVNIDQQTASKTIAQKAIAAGFDGIQVDGNDILASRQIIGEAIEKARQGKGATLIEALSYRLCDHTTADDASRYQPANSVSKAQLAEPIVRFKRYLEQQNLWDNAQEQTLLDTSAIAVQLAVDNYLKQTPQSINDMFDHHYAEIPNYLIEQKAIAWESVHD